MKVEEIQAAIWEEGVDGWLFFDHHRRDPLAYRILGLPDDLNPTRRWYYLIPTMGEPVTLVHRIEPHSLDALPGTTHMYSRWTEQFDELTRLLQGPKRLAMQYSPNCAIPYVSMVDGGTVELITRIGVQLVSSANLVQAFEARWSSDQLQMHLDTGKVVDEIRAEAFGRIAAGTGTPMSGQSGPLFVRLSLPEDSKRIMGLSLRSTIMHPIPIMSPQKSATGRSDRATSF